jgi:hypothetical protein
MPNIFDTIRAICMRRYGRVTDELFRQVASELGSGQRAKNTLKPILNKYVSMLNKDPVSKAAWKRGLAEASKTKESVDGAMGEGFFRQAVSDFKKMPEKFLKIEEETMEKKANPLYPQGKLELARSLQRLKRLNRANPLQHTLRIDNMQRRLQELKEHPLRVFLQEQITNPLQKAFNA